MKQQWVIFIIGVVIFFLPFLGIPRAIDNVLLILSGFIIVILSLRSLRKAYVKQLYNGGAETE
ncbi:MAG TPA: hypothetical protein VJI73_02930 [Candidatus Paceibacterota bacterium]